MKKRTEKTKRTKLTAAERWENIQHHRATAYRGGLSLPAFVFTDLYGRIHPIDVIMRDARLRERFLRVLRVELDTLDDVRGGKEALIALLEGKSTTPVRNRKAAV